MPLVEGRGNTAISKNIETEIRAGKKPAQAAAIAYSKAGRGRGLDVKDNEKAREWALTRAGASAE